MNTTSRDKIFGFLVSAAAATSFVATSDVSAAPVFPPQHVAPAAAFAAPGERVPATAPLPWYLSQQRADQQTRAAFPATVDATLADITVAPWYRAAN